MQINDFDLEILISIVTCGVAREAIQVFQKLLHFPAKISLLKFRRARSVIPVRFELVG